MELAQWCSSSRVIIVAGKGGVGKTTVSAAIAAAAVGAGRSALLVELDGKSGLGDIFARRAREAGTGRPGLPGPVGGHPRAPGSWEARPGLTVLPVAPDEALLTYLEDHGLGRISKRLVSSGALDVVATAVPGMRDILVLGRVKALQRAGTADVIVVDGPAAGHAVTFLRSPRGLLDAVRVGPILTQALEVSEMLSDPARATVVLVTLAEETPVNETVETAGALAAVGGLSLGPVVVNGLLPDRGLEIDLDAARVLADAAAAGISVSAAEAADLAEAARFCGHRRALQCEQLARLAAMLAKPQVPLPYSFSAALGPTELDRLAVALAEGVAAVTWG